MTLEPDPTSTPVPPAGEPSEPPAGPTSGDGPGRGRRFLALVVVLLVAVGLVLFAGGLPPGPDGPPDGSPGSSGGGSPIGSGSPGPDRTEPATDRPSPPPVSGDYLLIARSTLESLPMSGPAWSALVETADGSLGRARLRNQDARHAVKTLAVALVYARTGNPSYRDKARDAILDAIGTEKEGAHNSILALGRQLAAYVLAADLIDLSGADDETFRAWLDEIRTRDLGGHGRWRSLTATHEDSANNWGAFAGASRIAASLYLGDSEDVWDAAAVLRGFLGDRSAWSGFQPVDDSASWACDAGEYVPLNPPCVRDGVDIGGAIVRDISRGGDLRWPPGDDGVRYSLESLQGLTLQAELLARNGYGDPWTWSDSALRRAAEFVSRAGAAGGDTWDRSDVVPHLTWLLNARYDLGLETTPAGFGRVFGYTDWLYGSR